MDINNLIPTLTVAILPLIFAITLHEAAHGWVAYKLGDKTAFMLGRVSLNPIKHIDLFGTIILPILMITLGGFIFGWAKPVPISQRNLNNPKRDMAIVALAGPISNLSMAVFWALIAKLGFILFDNVHLPIEGTAEFLVLTGKFGIMINLVLAILNLIPLPPLDGSRLVSSLLPNHLSAAYDRLEPFGMWILLALLVSGTLQYIVTPPLYSLSVLINQIVGLKF